MDSTKLIALVAAGSSGSSLLSGSLFSEGGTRRPVIKLKMENPFAAFDLECLEKSRYGPQNSNKKTIFSGYNDTQEQTQFLNKPSSLTASSPFALPVPTKGNDQVEGCYKVTYHHVPDWSQIIAMRLEMAASKGNYGILLLNVYWNTKHYGGKTATFRAVFLQKEKDWTVKGGIQWTDEALMKSSADSRRLELNGNNFKDGKPKHILWNEDKTNQHPYDLLLTKANHIDRYSWKPDNAQQKTIFQELTIKAETPPAEPIAESFWNGTQEPVVANSSITKPVALYDTKDKLWKKTTETIDISTVKPWFDLFKDDKGKWETRNS